MPKLLLALSAWRVWRVRGALCGAFWIVELAVGCEIFRVFKPQYRTRNKLVNISIKDMCCMCTTDRHRTLCAHSVRTSRPLQYIFRQRQLQPLWAHCWHHSRPPPSTSCNKYFWPMEFIVYLRRSCCIVYVRARSHSNRLNSPHIPVYYIMYGCFFSLAALPSDVLRACLQVPQAHHVEISHIKCSPN